MRGLWLDLMVVATAVHDAPGCHLFHVLIPAADVHRVIGDADAEAARYAFLGLPALDGCCRVRGNRALRPDVTEDVHTGNRRDVAGMQRDDPEFADGSSRRRCPSAIPAIPTATNLNIL